MEIAAAAAAAALVIYLGVSVYGLLTLAEMQKELQRRGFVILDDPQAICTGGCHVAPQLGENVSPWTKTFPNVDPQLWPVPGTDEQQPDDCPQCTHFPPGTTPNYGTLDDFGRPRGISAVLKGVPDLGSDAVKSILPPGWTGGGATLANQARTHLLGKALGGSGAEPRNLVTFDQGANVRMYNEFENDAVLISSTGGISQCFRYTVTPEYLSVPTSPSDRTALMPHRTTGTLVNLCTGEVLINRRYVDNLLPH